MLFLPLEAEGKSLTMALLMNPPPWNSITPKASVG